MEHNRLACGNHPRKLLGWPGILECLVQARWWIVLVVLGMAACASHPGPGHIPPQGPEAEACIGYCEKDLDSCRAHLARAFQKCIQRYPGDVLDQNRCFERRRGAALERLELKIPIADGRCETRFDRCFMACGGRIEDNGGN